VAYLAVFGIGSILGMAFSTYLVSIPLSALKADGKAGRILAVCAGCLSLFVGIMLMLLVAIAEHTIRNIITNQE